MKSKRSIIKCNPIPEKYELMTTIFFAVIVFAVIILGTGSLWSGYHQVDDHNCIIRTALVKEIGLFPAIIETTKWDLSIRFRPFYWVLYVTKCALFGTNFTMWMIVSMIEGIISYILMYIFARRINCSQVQSFLFTIIVIFGSQFQPWFRSANQENSGFLLLSMALTFMTSAYLPPKKITSNITAGLNKAGLSHIKIYKILFVVCMTLSTLIKESFILFAPSYLMLIMFMIRQKDSATRFKSIFMRELPLIVYTIILVISELVFTALFVGTNKIGYAGFGNDVSILHYVKGIAKTVYYSNGLRWYAIATILLMGLGAYSYFVCHKKGIGFYQMFIKDNEWLLLSSLYIIIIQMVLYARSSMVERYILPCSFGIALFLVIYLPAVFNNDSGYIKAYTLIIGVLALVGVIQSVSVTREWSRMGYAFNKMLTATLNVISTNENTDILVNYGVEEPEGAVRVYASQFGNWNWYTAHGGVSYDAVKYFGRDFDYIISYYDGWFDKEIEYTSEAGIDRNNYQVAFLDPQKEFVILQHK